MELKMGSAGLEKPPHVVVFWNVGLWEEFELLERGGQQVTQPVINLVSIPIITELVTASVSNRSEAEPDQFVDLLRIGCVGVPQAAVVLKK
jgi:hypothetical protein